MIAFIVFYGLDWVATVPPTLALCREHFGARAPVVFGWIFASHQLGSAVAAFGGGVIRDVTGSYDLAWFLAGGALHARRGRVDLDPPQPAAARRDAAADEPRGSRRRPGARLRRCQVGSTVQRTVCTRIRPSRNTKVSTPSVTRAFAEVADHVMNRTSSSKIWTGTSQVASGTWASRPLEALADAVLAAAALLRT